MSTTNKSYLMPGSKHCTALLFMLVFTGCSQVYTLGYMSKVLINQDANTDDYLWKEAYTIPASSTPLPLPKSYEIDRVRNAFTQGKTQFNLESYLAESSSTALLVVKDGRLLYEQYFNGSSAEQLQATFSISKSIFSLLLGSVIEDYPSLSLSDPITDYLPELAARDSRFAGVDLASLIDMHSGIRYSTDTSFPFVNQDAPLVYYASNLRAVVLQKTTLESVPGEFHYNDYNPNMFALALERVVGKNPVVLVQEKLFEAIGAEDSALWSTDNHGFPYWESGFVATARDLAKIGQLMLDDGQVNSVKLISTDWHRRSTTYPDAELPEELDGRQWIYRNGWWQILRAAPPNDYAAIGRFGQMIYVSPAHGVVIVRTGTDQNPPSDSELTKLFYAATEALDGG